ncbi:hypothetical protein D1AOALGA4SA_7057 [Olavius algarvensis Delta 1 endosymbiont]|nr:hypothetical protein D1AOALGA4SA_7057 [Olavius algarvensis Delta 1 endosymbiont]
MFDILRFAFKILKFQTNGSTVFDFGIWSCGSGLCLHPAVFQAGQPRNKMIKILF